MHALGDVAMPQPHRKVSRKAAKRRELVKNTPNYRKIENRRTARGTKLPPWTAPDDMPDWQAVLVCAGKMCGSKLMDGGFCKLTPTPHQFAIGRQLPHRCNYHGGASPIEQPNIFSTTEHGFYSRAVLPGEESTYKAIRGQKSGFLDHEIAMTKLRLERALREEARQFEAVANGATREAMTLDSFKTNVDVGADGVTSKTERVLKLIDWEGRVNRICNSLVRMLAQKQIMEGENEMTPEERAAETRAILREARKSMGLTPIEE